MGKITYMLLLSALPFLLIIGIHHFSDITSLFHNRKMLTGT